MCLKSIKEGIMVPFMILLGTLRLLGFVFALTAMVSNFLGEVGVVDDLIKEDVSPYAFIQGWKWTAKIIETTVCILVMADTIVTTDGPFGEQMDEYSFLRIIKIPPALSRAVLWLIMLVIPCNHVQLFLMLHYNVSITTTTTFLLNAGRKLMAVPAVIYLIICVFRYWGKLVRRTDHTTGNSDHWHLQRYYEHTDFQKPQRLKQKVEKVIMIFACFLPIAGHVFNLVASFSDLPVFTNPSYRNGTTNATMTTRTEMSTTFIHLQNIFPISMSIFKDMLYYLDSIGKACIYLLFSVLLVIYFIVYQCKTMFLPVHTTVKIFHFYNFLSALPSNAAIAYIVTSTTGFSISSNTSLWIFALLPVIFFLQALPYILTRKIYQMLTDPVSFLKHIFLFFGELAQPSKLYRFFHCITLIIGVCGFICLLLGIPLPWIKIEFQPDEKLSKIFDLHDLLQASMTGVLSAFSQVVCIQAPKSSDITSKLDELKHNHPYCFDTTTLNDETYCKALAEGVKNASYVESTLPRACLPLDECLMYLPVMAAALVLINIPHCGPTAATMIRIARVGRKLIRLRKKFTKAGSTFESLYSALKALKLFFKRPIATNVFIFSTETYMLAFLLPCFLVGIASVSVGFWRRNAVPGGRLKVNRAYFLFLIFASNCVTMIFAFLYKHVLKALIDALPLMKADITELLGWHFVKSALLCSTLASCFLWIYSIADVVQSWSICNCLSTRRSSPERIEISTLSNTVSAPNSKTPSTPAKGISSSTGSEHKNSPTPTKGKSSTTPSKNKSLSTTPNEKSSVISSNDKSSTSPSKENASTTSKDKQLTQSKDTILSKASGNSLQSAPCRVKTLSKPSTENTLIGKGLPTTNTPQTITKFTGKINLARVWLMAMFPVAFAVIVMLISFSTADIVCTIHPRFTGNMGKMLTKLHGSSGLSAQYFEDAKEEESLCDVITSLVTQPFSHIFSALKSSILHAILEYDEEVLNALVLSSGNCNLFVWSGLCVVLGSRNELPQKVLVTEAEMANMANDLSVFQHDTFCSAIPAISLQ